MPTFTLSIKYLCQPILRRSFSSKTAEFITINQGYLVTQKVRVWLGHPHESFVLVPTDIGRSMKAASILPSDLSLAKNPEECSLTFYHDSQHFAPESLSYPRLVIPQNLPRQSDANTSPATLYLFGITHTIALDGTEDADFAQKSRDTLRTLGPALEALKDR